MRDDHFWSKASLRVFLEKTLSVIFAIFIWINQSELLMVFEQRLNFPSIAHQRLSRFFANTSPSGLPWWPHIRNFMLFKDLYVRAGRVTLWRACAGTGPAHQRPAWDRGSAWLRCSESLPHLLLLSLFVYFKIQIVCQYWSVSTFLGSTSLLQLSSAQASGPPSKTSLSFIF